MIHPILHGTVFNVRIIRPLKRNGIRLHSVLLFLTLFFPALLQAGVFSEIENGNIEAVQKRLTADRNGTLATRNRDGASPLLLAVLFRQHSIAKLFLEAGHPVDIQTSPKYDQVPFDLAAKNADQSMMELLLFHGSKRIQTGDPVMELVSSNTLHEVTPEHQAEIYPCFLFLIEKGAKWKSADHFRMAYRNPKVIDYYFDRGIVRTFHQSEINQLENWYAFKGNFEVYRRLNELSPFDLALSRKENQATPLHNVCNGTDHREDRLKILQSALEAGIPVDEFNRNRGWTPLRQCADSRSDLKVMEALLKAGADPNMRDSYGCTILTEANRTKFDYPEKLDLLQRFGAVFDPANPVDCDPDAIKAPLPKKSARNHPAHNSQNSGSIEGEYLRLDRKTFQTGENITIHFSGIPGNQQDWITLVPVGSPENEWGTWSYLKGKKSGLHTIKAPSPGKYEIRLYFDWPRGKYDIKDQIELEVHS